MKKVQEIFQVTVVSVFFLFVASCGQNNEVKQDGIVISQENLVEVNYAVEGMVCAMGCAKAIEDKIAEMDGVVNCAVSFEDEKASITFDGGHLKEQDIINEIQGLADGRYRVSEWKNDAPAEVENAEEHDGNESDEDVMEHVSMPSFEIPNLFLFLVSIL